MTFAVNHSPAGITSDIITENTVLFIIINPCHVQEDRHVLSQRFDGGKDLLMEMILTGNVSVNVFNENYGEKSHHSVMKMRQKLKYILCRLLPVSNGLLAFIIQSCVITLILVEEI